MNLSRKLTFIILLVVIPIVVGVSLLVYLSTARIVEGRIKGQLVQQGVHMMDKMDRVLYNKFLNMKMLAADPYLRSGRSTPAMITKRLDEFVSVHKTYASASFFTLERVRVADTKGLELGRRHSKNEYWLALEGGAEFAFDFSASESLKVDVLHLARVVMGEGGRPVGVVVARMDMDEVAKMLGSPNLDASSFEVDLVDSSGRVVYSSGALHTTKDGRFTEWELFKEAGIGGGNSGAFTHHSPGEEEEVYVWARSLGFKDFNASGLTVIMDFPRATTFAEVVRLRNALFLVLSVAGAAIIGIVYLMSRRITAPLAELALAAEAVGRGNLNAEIDSSYRSGDEVGRLFESFDKMLNGLRDYRDRLLVSNAEAEDARRKLERAEGIGRLGHFEWNVSTGAVALSPEAARILCVGRAAVNEGYTHDALLAAAHPEDREMVHRAEAAALESGRHAVEFRLIFGDGSTRRVSARGEVAFGLSGLPVKMLATLQDVTEEREREDKLKRLNAEFTGAMASVKLLSGLLPICASCKKIRDDGGYWNTVEQYITEHSEAEFTHGICPDCAKKLYGEFYKEKK